ncbi:MAG TPA: adenylate/guanylate cyclase domain-containing protein, partial [Isosphaeraceae bacterium]|nr:adenylate/guanylate cyclase domain-containing protein [Isosphaeraceae bacterium]
EEIVHWLQGTLSVLQSAANSSDFFDKAARALVEAVGLDSGRVLLREGDSWRMVASHCSGGSALPERPPSRLVLDRVRHDRRTFYFLPEEVATASGLGGIEAVVAAPILDESGEVLGLLYGDRQRSSDPGGLPSIGEIEALLVELLASSVAGGLARTEMSRAATAARVQLEQFFTVALAHQIAERPELLEGQDAEITVLFCDIRGFSRISERLGPTWTVNWINNVMGTLSDCVLDHDGVLVDYIGDMIMAMWGAPEARPDHAALACEAAIQMISLIPELNARWEPTLGEPMDLGIGLNTGVARVGNIGSHRKFKYGPLGNTVNVASRVEGLNRHLKTRLLLTEATQAHLDASFPSRRLGLVKVNNIIEPIELYELPTPGRRDWPTLRRDYESALANFESRSFLESARTLGDLLPEHPEDGPSLILMSRVVNAMVDPETFSRVFLPPGSGK